MAQDRPMPIAAPVMIATSPSRSPALMSLSFEHRFALVEESGNALLTIFGPVKAEQNLLLETLSDGKSAVRTLPDEPLHLGLGERRYLQHGPSPFECRRHQLLVRTHGRGKSELEGALAGDAAGAEHDVRGHIFADRTREPLGSAAAGR